MARNSPAQVPAPERSAYRRVARAHLGVLGGDQAGEVDHDLGLLPGGVVLHLAVDHDGAGAVRHGVEDLAGERHLAGIGREDPLGDGDLRGMQRPGAGAAHQEGVAELRLAGGRIGEVAERAVERLDAGGRAGIDHLGDGVVPEVLLEARARGRRPPHPRAPCNRDGRRRRASSSWRARRRGRPARG